MSKISTATTILTRTTTTTRLLTTLSSSLSSRLSNSSSTSASTSRPFTTTTSTPAQAPSILPLIDYCLNSHNVSFCNYISVLIFIGYFLRILIIALLFTRFCKLKSTVEALSYNLSFTWLWLITTCFFIDIIEYVYGFNGHLYTKYITICNFLSLVLCLCLNTMYVYYRTSIHQKGHQYQKFLISICFILLWVIIIIVRSAKVNSSPLYILIYFIFAAVQVWKITVNTNAKCLTHTSYGIWLLCTFFHTTYQTLVEKSNTTQYIHFKGFFEITTLIVILLQNIYYGDRQAKQQAQFERVMQDNADVFEQEMVTNPKNTNQIYHPNTSATTSGGGGLNRERSNSAYFYFKDVDNIITESNIYPQEAPAQQQPQQQNDEDEIYFDRDLTMTKLTQPTFKLSVLNLFKPKSPVDYNDSLQQGSTTHTSPHSKVVRTKFGICFAYTKNNYWKIILCILSVIYYFYALVVLIRACGRTPLVIFLAPFLHSFVISCAWLYKKKYFCKPL